MPQVTVARRLYFKQSTISTRENLVAACRRLREPRVGAARRVLWETVNHYVEYRG